MEGKEEDVKVGANKFLERPFYGAGIAEFIATFLFLYITVLTVMGVFRALKKCASVGIQGIAWAFGGMIFALDYCTAGISDNVIRKYKKAKSNFSILEELGASHLHGVDETQMKFHSNFPMQAPHGGFHMKENDKQAKSNFSILENLGASHLHGVDETQMKFHSNFPMQVPHAGLHRKENDKQAKSNFSILEKLEASHLHGVDATQMKFHSNFPMQVPLAGFHRKENDKRVIRRERRIKHYSSTHKILLVGEGDFSFSKCLATAFGTAVNMTATSLDNRGRLAMKYSCAIANVEELENLGCTIIHGVDAHTMKHHSKLISESFNRIVFNFPHSGFSRRPEQSSHMIKFGGIGNCYGDFCEMHVKC